MEGEDTSPEDPLLQRRKGCPIPPDFLLSPVGLTSLHAAFLNESRTRGH